VAPTSVLLSVIRILLKNEVDFKFVKFGHQSFEIKSLCFLMPENSCVTTLSLQFNFEIGFKPKY
jgi:hypothetical protein